MRSMNKMKILSFTLTAVLGVTLCACGSETTGSMTITETGTEQTVEQNIGTEQTNSEKSNTEKQSTAETSKSQQTKKESYVEIDNVLDEINTEINPGTAGSEMNSIKVAAHLLNWGVGTSMTTDEIKKETISWLSVMGNSDQVEFSSKLALVYKSYNKLLGPDAEQLLESAGCDDAAYPWSDSPVETIEAIIDVVQLPENGENMVENQPTEDANLATDDDESQEDFSEEIEEENQESSLENEDYSGEDVVEIINLQGETTTVYKLADGRYMDRIERIFIFDGVDTWTDTNGVEWNQAVN